MHAKRKEAHIKGRYTVTALACALAFSATLPFIGTAQQPKNQTAVRVLANFIPGAGILGAGGQDLLARLLHIPAGDFAIGTDGKIWFMGSHTESDLKAQPGEFRISGITGESVEISCADKASISNGSQELAVSGVEIVAGQSHASQYGKGTSCANTTNGQAVQHVLTGQNKRDTILLGARVQVSHYLTRTLYSSRKGAGEPVNIEVNYI